MRSKPRRPFSRRDFLKMSGGTLALAGLPSLIGCEPTPEPAASAAMPDAAPAMAQIPIGVQLYCFRHQLEEDFPGTLAQVAALGFEGVEFADYFGYSAQELRQILDDNGVKCCGTHIHIETMQGDELQKSIDFNLALGNPYLIVRSLREERQASKEAILRTAEELNEISEKLKPHGLRTGYHCHDYSFSTMFDGESIWDLLGDNTSDDFVLQLDTANASDGGGDIPAALQRHPGKIKSMHVKPYSRSAEDPFIANIGDDELDWPQIFNLSETVGGIEWYIVEYEHEAFPPLEALKTNLDNVLRIRAA